MNSKPVLTQRIKSLLCLLAKPEFTILWVGLLAYGVFIPLLGLYWDDIALTWIFDGYGNPGLAKYFSTERPFWGLLYQLNMPILGLEAWKWQAFGLFWRLAASYGLFFVIRQLWKESQEPAFLAALIYLVYPGFNQQFIGNTYGHFFQVFAAYFFSVGLSLYALEHKKGRTWIIPLAVFLGAVNVFCMEYYFMLELMRPVFFWVKLRGKGEKWIVAIKDVMINWLPYFLVFLAAGVWRVFYLSKLTYLSGFIQTPSLNTNPWGNLLSLVKQIPSDIWLTVVTAWSNPFRLVLPAEFGLRPWLFYIGAVIAVVILLLIAYRAMSKSAKEEVSNSKRNAIQFLLFGIIALFLAGVPFWATGLNLRFDFPADRFVLPFILGSSMILIAVFMLLLGSKVRRLLFSVLIALSVGYQVWLGFTYYTAWTWHQRFIWQMAWRIPAIEPNTLFISDELPVQFYTDNSITAAINLIYNPNPDSERIDYLHYFPTIRPHLDLTKKAQPIKYNLRIGEFNGNTNQSIIFTYIPPSCFRVVDAEVEADNIMLPDITLEAISLSPRNPILLFPQALPPKYLYGEEPRPTWCYYFEKADLARQQADWQTVVELAEVGLELSPGATDPAELFPFIEGFAHTGEWQRALDLSQNAMEINWRIESSLCRLWERIDLETTSDSINLMDKNEAHEKIAADYQCFLP